VSPVLSEAAPFTAGLAFEQALVLLQHSWKETFFLTCIWFV